MRSVRINLQTWPQVSPSFLSPLGFKMRVLPWNSKLPQAKISKLVEWAQGRPFPGVDAGFQSLGFRYQRVSSCGKVLWTTWFCPHIPWGLSPHLPLTTAPEEWGERPPCRKRDPHTLLSKSTQNHQRPGGGGPRESRSPVGLFNADPALHLLILSPTLPCGKDGKIQPRSSGV